jgi:hypothetical protein
MTNGRATTKTMSSATMIAIHLITRFMVGNLLPDWQLDGET